MAECPDNSTECLLRAVLESLKQNKAAIEEANAEYNWDPATFAITLVIGILAFVVACLTVFQGLLAAGPGRIKAGESAIGPWSRFSKSRFSKNELGIRTTAESPVLDRIWDGRNLHRLNYQDPRTRLRNQSFHHQYGSSWATLLHRVECNYVGLPTRAHNTDYLPADIPGVPALGRITLLVILTALADDYCSVGVSPAKRYAEVECPHSALRMRDHSQLGTIAVYETWGNPKTLSGLRQGRRYVFKDEVSALLEIGEAWGLGFDNRLAGRASDVKYPLISEIRSRSLETFIFGTHPLAHSGLPSLPLNMISFGLPARPRLFPKGSVDLVHITMQLARGSFWQALDGIAFEKAYDDLLASIWPPSARFYEFTNDASIEHFIRRASDMVDFIEDNPYLHWTQRRDTPILDLRSGRDTASPEPSPAELQVVLYFANLLRPFLGHVEEFHDSNERSPKEPLFLKGVPQDLAKDTRAETQLALQVLVMYLDSYLAAQNRLDVHCALLALTRSIAICNAKHDASSAAPATRPQSSSRQSSTTPVARSPPRSRSGVETGYIPTAKYDLPKEAYDEAYLDSVPESLVHLGATISPQQVSWPDLRAARVAGVQMNHEYKPCDMNKIALLAETLRMRGLLVTAVLDLCADSTPFLDEKFDDRLVAFI